MSKRLKVAYREPDEFWAILLQTAFALKPD